MKSLSLFILLCLVCACDTGGGKRADAESLRFRTTDDAELFFRNLRRTEYNHQNLKAARLDIFRHEKRTRDAPYPLMMPALVINWRYDEAYIILEGNEWIGEIRPLIVLWRDSLPRQEGRYVLESNNKMEQLQFASLLYNGMQEGQQFYLERDAELVPFLNMPRDRQVFRQTMLDFYRLTGVVR